MLGICFFVGIAAVALLFWASRSSRSTACAGFLTATIAIFVGAAGYLACYVPQLTRYCIHAGAVSSRSGILIALGLGALLASFAILAFTFAKSILGKVPMPPVVPGPERGD
jgi:hypothetical protein